jgi:uncharacterized membrane protein
MRHAFAIIHRMPVEALNCPKCGAPLPAFGKHTVAICVYCNSNVRLKPGPAGQPEAATLSAEELPAGVVARIKELVAIAHRAEAIKLYQQYVRVDEDAADAAVERLGKLIIFRLTDQMPLNWLGAFTGSVPIVLSAIGAAWAASLALAAGGLAWEWLLALGLAALSLYWLRGYLRRLRSNVVTAVGPHARAEVIRLGIISDKFRDGGTLVTVEMDVRPDDGRPAFRDQETMLVRNESLPKLQPGQVIRVRYDPLGHDRVFPDSPIKAWDETAQGFG